MFICSLVCKSQWSRCYLTALIEAQIQDERGRLPLPSTWKYHMQGSVFNSGGVFKGGTSPEYHISSEAPRMMKGLEKMSYE